MALTLGYWSLLLAFILCAVSFLAAAFSFIAHFRKAARIAAYVTWGAFVCLTVSCGVLVVCFFAGDTSIYYVVSEMPKASGAGAWLYKLAGLWGGREGSLLFWAWLISLMNSLVALRLVRRGNEALDTLALAVAELVLLAFLGVLVFSTNQPFVAVPDVYLSPDGSLAPIAAQALGMNMLLLHWAMAVHPPTLFIGYAGFTIPFAYALATVILGRADDAWVRRATPYTMVSWFFLTIGIGLGAVWAYVVLGWGGYWGWDPVENASLLPWLVGLALIHSFTVYRQRGAFKRWTVLCACLAFCFVVLGTFITRSGVVQSVHAFEGDPVSLNLFLGLIIVSLVCGIAGVAWRWKTLRADTEEGDDIESFASKDAAYYVNNLVMIIFTFVLAYFTLASALPSWLPLGGYSVTTGTYESIARPLGIIYCLLIAVCPLLSWGRTGGATFRKRALVPGLCALAVFAGLLAVFFTKLLPSYNAIMSGSATAAMELAAYGPSWYYNGLAVLGFAVAALLFMNALFVLAKALRAHAGDIRARLSLIGGSVAHLAMAFILVGLIGSAMYVTQQTSYLLYDEEADTVASTIRIQEYELAYTGADSEYNTETGRIVYTVNFDVTKDGRAVGTVSPRYEVSMATGQTKLDASVLHFAGEDLFVVFSGFTSSVYSDTQSSMVVDVRVNPLISFVWVGFVMMLVGMAVALFARRSPREAAKVGTKAAKAELAAAKAADDAEATDAAEGAAE